MRVRTRNALYVIAGDQITRFSETPILSGAPDPILLSPRPLIHFDPPEVGRPWRYRFRDIDGSDHGVTTTTVKVVEMDAPRSPGKRSSR